MPVISRFYGISIKMYFNDHMPAHFHAIYGEFVGLYDLKKLELIEGDLPIRANNLVLEWAKQHKDELLRIWDTQEFHSIDGIE